LCILSVFIPAFIMEEPVRSLFVPLSLAVGFSMIGSYVLSSTLVPVLATMLLQGPKVPRGVPSKSAAAHAHEAEAPATGHGPEAPAAGRKTEADDEWLHKGFFGHVQNGFIRFVRFSIRWRWIVLPAYLAGCLLVIVLLGMQLGRELFPTVDQGEFVLRFRMPSGTNYELTRQAWLHCLHAIEEEAGPGNVHISMGFAGQQAPDFTVNNMILFMSGPEDGQIRVRLREGSGVAVAALQERLRRALPERMKPWLADVLRHYGYSEGKARERADLLRFGFEPGDIVSQVMSFGSPTPIEVVVSCPRWNDDAYAYVDRLVAELKTNEHLRDLQIHQTLHYPYVEIRIDRAKANLSGGITIDDVGNSLVAATSSSRMLFRNYWIDNRLGASYQVQVQMAVPRMTSAEQLKNLPLALFGEDRNLLVRDVAGVSTGFAPGEIDRTAMQRYLSISANVEGEDLGRAARQIDEAIARVDTRVDDQMPASSRNVVKPGRPVGVTVVNRGQVQPMYELFRSLAIGLAWSVFVIFVMLTAYFQSPRLALASLGSVPGVLSGVVVILYLTNTTLNIEAFMGTIMSIGVSVSNSVMLVTFISMVWEKGVPVQEAAIRGAGERLRPILMTASAMTIGMVPMSLGLEAGSKMEAPLGLAVIGGLVMSTFATLLILPAFFSLIMGRSRFVQPSIDPEDPDSTYYDGGEDASRRHRQAQGGGPAGRRPVAAPAASPGDRSRGARETPTSFTTSERERPPAPGPTTPETG
ncbi:MAG: efflux RND transporter permease subunit, partial [Isosphaeraceae bacterium]